MKARFRNTGQRASGAGAFAGDKKKTVAAFCLVGVMVVMWGRMLLRKPGGAQAATIPLQNVSNAATKGMVDVCFVELPRTAGRNDVLSRDLFVSNGWEGFAIEGVNTVGGRDVNVSSQDKNGDTARRVASRLKLQAIWMGSLPQAFINEKMLRVGDRFVVKERKESCECEVMLIEDGRVVLRCGEAEIELKLSQPSAMQD